MIYIKEETFAQNYHSDDCVHRTVTVNKINWDYELEYCLNNRTGYIYYRQWYNGYYRYYRYKNYEEFYREQVFKRELYGGD